jgi:hypothetical protein
MWQNKNIPNENDGKKSKFQTAFWKYISHSVQIKSWKMLVPIGSSLPFPYLKTNKKE